MNKEFLKMQKLAGLITENQIKDKLNEFDKPAYEPINDLMDAINMATGMKGNLTTYSKISWLPGIDPSDDPENLQMLVYKKGKQEIAIGQDDVYQEDMWQINTNDPNLDFGQDLKANQVVDKVSNWLNSVNEANEYEYENDETFNIIDSIIGEKLKDNFIKSVEAIKSAVEAAGNKDIDRGDVYDYLLMMMEEDD